MNTRTKSICLGDKIFARVTRNGRTVYNFVSEKVANMSDLLRQIRFAIKDIQGLVMIHIRNYNQGWGEERPLMLYAVKTDNMQVIPPSEGTKYIEKPISRMLFPWETH